MNDFIAVIGVLGLAALTALGLYRRYQALRHPEEREGRAPPGWTWDASAKRWRKPQRP